jgi:hypothetical protein
MFDIVFVGNNQEQYNQLKKRVLVAKKADSVQKAQQISLTNFVWIVFDDIEIENSFNFDYVPDEWSQDLPHVFLNDKTYDGVFLLPKNKNFSDKELVHRFFVQHKKVDIVASKPLPYNHFYIDTYEQYLQALETSSSELFWVDTKNIKSNIPDLYFTHHDTYNRRENHAFIHAVDGRQLYNGLFLCSKHKPVTKKEIEHRHLVSRKEWDIVASGPVSYDKFIIETYDDYKFALANSKTEMFWADTNNIDTSQFDFDVYFTHDNKYDRNTNHAFAHKVNGEIKYNGLFLFSKQNPITAKEIEYRHVVNAKEWDIVGSGPTLYQKYYFTCYEEYLDALENSPTEMFWFIPNYVNPTPRFKFDTYFSHDQTFDRNINHAFLNGKYHDGIILCSKYAKFSKREFEYKFIANKKEVDITISTPNPYDIVFISYQEPNADENYQRILKRFPNCKRVHGVKGIHQAHIEAAKLCNTDMFWIIDGDAIIVDDFKFDYQVARWDKECVHVWRSQNPINDMVYGYGGVKLFPTELTINMDTSKPDMTTSISSKFKAVHDISNITAFNTDEFNSFKSGFRECCKLSSKVIDRQKDDETNERLRKWCTVGDDRKYGKYAIAGAKAGAAYGARYKGDLQALKKINDFDWLKEQFDNANI